MSKPANQRDTTGKTEEKQRQMALKCGQMCTWSYIPVAHCNRFIAQT